MYAAIVRRVLATLALLLAASGLVLAQRWPRGFDALRAPLSADSKVPYDGRFAFVRVTYETLPGGYWYRGQPAWSHGYPESERNLMQIIQSVTSLRPHVTETGLLSLEDPEIFRYPVLYLIEPSWWRITDAEADNLRTYLDKGGFVIVDDFKTEQWRGGRGWAQFADNMRQVVPNGEFADLDITHPIFHQFFDIASLEIFPQAYNDGRPVFRGLYQDNDRSRPLQMFVAYNTDISQFWEWSERGLRSIADTNEAYKLGVNALLYGIMH